jgi:hypothetical protein
MNKFKKRIRKDQQTKNPLPRNLPYLLPDEFSGVDLNLRTAKCGRAWAAVQEAYRGTR